VTDTPTLQLRGITKSFGSVQALADVDFEVRAGEVMALVGDNGAGKSTLVKTVAGIHQPDSGEILFEGKPVHISSPKEASRLGIEIVYQDLALCDNLTAAANVFLGRELTRRAGPLRLLDYGAMYERAAELFAELKSETRPHDLVRRMSGGQRQAVAIARAVQFNARVLIMDEPTAALGPAETAQVHELVAQLKTEGLGIFLISHDIHDVFDLADRISVMLTGRLVDTVDKNHVTKDEVLAMIILGKKPGEVSDTELADLTK
jgi:ABC-type sugar transport system ATPase subunit